MSYKPAEVTMELPEASDDPAEMALIGCCILGGTDTFMEVSNVVTPEVFNHSLFKQAFELMAEMVADSIPIDVAAVMMAWGRKFNVSCPQSVWLSSDFCPAAPAWPCFVEVVVESYSRRKIVEVASETISAAKEGMHNSQELKAILDGIELGMERGSFVDGKDPLAVSFRASLLEQMKKSSDLAGLTTGFRGIDAATDGLVPATMSVLAARPSEGKTALGLSILYKMCFQLQIPCLFISIEMKKNAIMTRLASMATGIPAKKIRRADFTDAEGKKMKWFFQKIKEAPFWISEAPGATIADIERHIRTAVKRHQVAAVFVDYLQIIRYQGKLSKRYEMVQENSQRLSALAKRYGPHVCALAQVNRKSAEENRPPRVNEIADSDQIEKDAELVLLLHRPKDERGFRNKEAILALGKVREGETGTVKLEFDGPHVQFVDPQTKIHDEDIPNQGTLEV